MGSCTFVDDPGAARLSQHDALHLGVFDHVQAPLIERAARENRRRPRYLRTSSESPRLQHHRITARPWMVVEPIPVAVTYGGGEDVGTAWGWGRPWCVQPRSIIVVVPNFVLGPRQPVCGARPEPGSIPLSTTSAGAGFPPAGIPVQMDSSSSSVHSSVTVTDVCWASPMCILDIPSMFFGVTPAIERSTTAPFPYAVPGVCGVVGPPPPVVPSDLTEGPIAGRVTASPDLRRRTRVQGSRPASLLPRYVVGPAI